MPKVAKHCALNRQHAGHGTGKTRRIPKGIQEGFHPHITRHLRGFWKVCRASKKAEEGT